MYFQRILELRKKHTLTQQDVANLLHCQHEYNVSVDYILGETDKRERY